MTKADRFKQARTARHNSVLIAATQLSRETGLSGLTRQDVAARAGVAAGSVNFAFVTMSDLKREVVRNAVKVSDYPLVAQAMALRGYDDLIPAEVRAVAACSLA